MRKRSQDMIQIPGKKIKADLVYLKKMPPGPPPFPYLHNNNLYDYLSILT